MFCHLMLSFLSTLPGKVNISTWWKFGRIIRGIEIWEDELGIGESFKEAGNAAVYLYFSGAQSSCRNILTTL